jgi:hypothetical protein
MARDRPPTLPDNKITDFYVGQWVHAMRTYWKHAYTGQVVGIINTDSSQFLILNDHFGEIEYKGINDVFVIHNAPDP